LIVRRGVRLVWFCCLGRFSLQRCCSCYPFCARCEANVSAVKTQGMSQSVKKVTPTKLEPNTVLGRKSRHMWRREGQENRHSARYPWGISQEKPTKGNVNMWSQRKLMLRLATTLESAGIPAFAVSEDGTSRECAYHNVEVERSPRGLIHCPHGHTLHADVNGGLNIMARGLTALGIQAELPRQIRVLSFLATPSGVKPINP